MSRLKKSGKCTGTTTCVTDQNEEPSNCIICLERVSCRGKLSVCNHWFCFPCILEWAENTNTCPICKVRFRCITKIHLSPFKSPPTKVRIGDRDQRVWNDDDDLVAEDVLNAIDSDDLDDDYEPPVHLDNPWTRSSRSRGRQQGNNVRDLVQTSRQLQLDEYDLEDSFIDDADEALQAYLFSAYDREDDFDVDADDGGSDTGDSDVEMLPLRVSPYSLRSNKVTHRRSSRSALNSLGSLPELAEEQSCPSPSSTDSFIVSDESADGLNIDWVPFGSHNTNSRSKNKNHVKRRNQGSEESRRSQKSQSRTVKSHQSQRLPKQQEPDQGRKRRGQQTSASDDDFQGPTSSRDRKTTNQSVNGWISMADRRTRAKASASTNTSCAYPRTRGRNSTKMPTRSVNCNGKKLPKRKGSEDYYRGSDSDLEVLRDISNYQKEPCNSKISYTSINNNKHTRNKPPIKLSSNLNQNQHCIPYALRSTKAGNHDDTPGESSEDDSNSSDALIVQPTPCAKMTRSIFTRRRHRSPVTGFDGNCDLLNGQGNACNWSAITHEDSAMKDGLSCQVKISPILKNRKQKRKRILSLSSDSD